MSSESPNPEEGKKKRRSRKKNENKNENEAPDVLREYVKKKMQWEEEKYGKTINEISSEIKGDLRKMIEVFEEELKLFRGPLPMSIEPRADVIMRLRDTVQKMATMFQNSGAEIIGLSDGEHFVPVMVVTEEKGIPTMPRKRKIPPDVINNLLQHKIESYPCPICGKPAKLVMKPGFPPARAYYRIAGIMLDIIDEEQLPEIASKAPFHYWADKVTYLGPASEAKLLAILQASMRQHITPKTSSIWRLCGLVPISYCPVDALIDETPPQHHYKCPKCGRVLIDRAPTKINIKIIQNEIGTDLVEVVRGNDTKRVKLSEYIKHAVGVPKFNSYMRVIAEQYRPTLGRKHSVYTMIALEKMLQTVEAKIPDESPLATQIAEEIAAKYRLTLMAIEELQKRKRMRLAEALRKSLKKGTPGVAVIYDGFGIWRDIAKILLDHMVAATLIKQGVYQGPPPVFKEGLHRYIPPLVDTPPEKALEDEDVRAMVEWYEDHGYDVVKYWRYYQHIRDHKFGEMYSELTNAIEKFVEKHGQELAKPD